VPGNPRVLARRIAANKLCVPNQIELHHRLSLFGRFLFASGIFTGMRRIGIGDGYFPGSYACIDDYAAHERVRFVMIVRRPEAVIASGIQRSGYRARFIRRQWARGTQVLAEAARRNAARTHVVSFERLVLQPEPTIRRLCNFLELSFDARMLRGYEHNPAYRERGELDTDRARPVETTPGLMPGREPGEREALAAYATLMSAAGTDETR
jgi:hypothetical protein